MIQEHSERLLQFQQSNTQLNQQLSQQEIINTNLKRYIMEQKQKDSSYQGAKDDPIDQKIGDYINSLKDSDRVKSLLIREGQGVYQFGSKKIYVKIDKEKILVRVGGGFISIQEFLDIYLTPELEKQQKTQGDFLKFNFRPAKNFQRKYLG